MKKWLAKLQQELDDHVFFWTALVVVLFVFMTVPQVAHIWRQAQPNGMGLLYLPFVGFIALIIAFYLASLVTVLRPMPIVPLQHFVARWYSRRPRPIARILARLLWWPPELCCRILPAARAWLWRHHPGERSLRTATGVLVLAAMIYFAGAPADGSRAYPLAGVACRYVALFSLVIGIWLLRPSSTGGDHHIGPAVGRLISWAAASTLLGEAIWLASAHNWGGFSYRLYSIWAFCHLSVGVLLIALLIDRMHCAWDFPVRPLAVTLCAWLVLHQGNPQAVRGDESSRFQTAAQRVSANPQPQPLDWRSELLTRIRAIPAREGPVVFVAASGGGSRAAIFSALCLELLARTPIAARPIFSGQRDGGAAKERTFADNIVLISSVSGGSLASADFVSERARGRHLAPIQVSQNSTESELVSLGLAGLGQQLERLAASTPAVGLVRPTRDYKSDLPGCIADWQELERAISEQALREPASAVAGNQLDEVDRWLALLEATRCLKAHETEPSVGSPSVSEDTRVDWVLHSRNLDRMCTDFMAPLMRGLLSVDLYRGDALARFWTEVFEWHGASTLRGPTSDFAWPAARHLPCVIYNATDVAKGRRLAIGLPPLPVDLWDASEVFQLPERLRPASISSMAPLLDLTLARAVRMSSNFPWGFRVQEVLAEQKPPVPPVRVLDGGVVDNTGLDTLFHLVTALRLEAESTDQPRLATDILAELRTRGVLILEIDAGAKPDGKVVTGEAAAVVEPFTALTNAAYSQAERARLFYVEQLSEILAPGGSVEVGGVGAFHVAMSCNHVDDQDQRSSDVMTAWTLGPRDKAEVLTRFFGQIAMWDRSREKVTRTLHTLQTPQDAMATQQDLNRRTKAGARMDKQFSK